MLTSGGLSDGELYYNAESCAQVFSDKERVIFLVHGYYPSLWKDSGAKLFSNISNGGFQSLNLMDNVSVSWLWDFYDIKDRILEHDGETENNKAVIIVNWTKGSEVHFGLLLRDAMEGVIKRLTETATNFAPIISSIVADATSLG